MSIDQKGFSGAYVLVALVILGTLGFAGWRVYENRKIDKADTISQNEHPTPQTDKTLDTEALQWQKATSRLGGFSIRIPDGWKVINYASNNHIRSDDLTYQKGKKATIENFELSYSGDTIARLDIIQFKEADKIKYLDGDEISKPLKIGSLEGVRYYKRYPVAPPEGLGPYPGMEKYAYEFRTPGKVTYVVYRIFNDNQYMRQVLSGFTESDKNQADLVERMVRTLEL